MLGPWQTTFSTCTLSARLDSAHRLHKTMLLFIHVWHRWAVLCYAPCFCLWQNVLCISAHA